LQTSLRRGQGTWPSSDDFNKPHELRMIWHLIFSVNDSASNGMA